MLAGGQLALMTALAGRLYYLQILKGDTYRTLADNNRIRIKPLLPVRGRILDSTGRVLAGNGLNYRLLLEVVESKEKTREVLQRISQLIYHS